MFLIWGLQHSLTRLHMPSMELRDTYNGLLLPGEHWLFDPDHMCRPVVDWPEGPHAAARRERWIPLGKVSTYILISIGSQPHRPQISSGQAPAQPQPHFWPSRALKIESGGRHTDHLEPDPPTTGNFEFFVWTLVEIRNTITSSRKVRPAY